MAIVLVRYNIAKGQQPVDKTDRSPPSPKKVWNVTEVPTPEATQIRGPEAPQQLPNYSRDYQDITADTDDDDDQQEQNEQELQAIENLAMEIGDLTANTGHVTTEELLLTAVQQVINRYPEITNDEQREAISNMIIRAALQDCGLTISLSKVRSLWPAVS
ncbi:hypothetical protein MKQ70_32515 [Chitinophaga sedimenti]|uniref:hypothetical protein n=1 Tax=Chitinophaga sedimenti TaxID=2033606 RepID=UPI0020052122|nr:hypothetical protein [Chitinophaga sedimenti]MCK7559441.1 hypothetical protein [Chitinophaga sedimenti]